MKDIDNIQDKFRGMLVGLAVGDAVGTTNEFRRDPESITDMVGGGPFFLEPGQWTDDTSMALCLADSLIEKEAFDYTNQLKKYVEWWKHGYNSVLGNCFDIGNTTQQALSNFIATGDEISPYSDHKKAGNGSLMRLAPIVIAYIADGVSNVCYWAGESSKTTHSAINAVASCRYFAKLLCVVANGETKENLETMPIDDLNLTTDVADIANTNFKLLTRSVVANPSGFVLTSLTAALYCFYNTDNFRDGCLLAANLGGDADTVAAIYGQIAGAFYGFEGIPQDWFDKLAWNAHIVGIADKLMKIREGHD